MLQEDKVESRHRFLQLICRVNNDFLTFPREKTLSMIKSKKLVRDNLINDFLRWRETKDEIGFYSDLAYADLQIPKKFNCIFDYQNRDKHEKINMTLTQSIWSFGFPINTIEHGHRHLIILKFEDKE